MSNLSDYQVFLSYHEQDEPVAEEIARRLNQAHGIQAWLKAWSVIPGRLTQEEQEKGLAEAHACAVLIGQEGVKGWQQLQVYSSIQKRIETEGSNFPVIPVFLPDCPKEIRKNLAGTLRLYEPVTFAGLDDAEALRRLICGIRGEPPGLAAPSDIPCPYPGLDPFREEMAPYFYGRDEEINQLRQMLETGPFVVVIGPSGSGKSSIVLAGLIPRLRGTAPRPSPYHIHSLTPGREPLQSLALCFTSEPGDPRRNQLAAAFAADPHELSRAAQAELKRQPAHVRHLLFVVDQFEEVFTQSDDAAQRAAFIHNLLHACTEANGAIQVVFTLRSDFYSPCFDYPQLVEPRRLLTIAPLRGELLRRTIEASARDAGLYFQRGLVDTLLDDAGDEAGSLPLIQFALRQLFDQRSGRWLTADAYYALGSEVDPALGGVRGVVAARAEAALTSLKANAQFDPQQVEPLVRRILLRLVQVGENSPPTRQQVARHEFFWASDTEQQRALLEAGLELLIRERLLTGHKAENDVVHVNLAHEVIIKSWKRLANWVDESKEDLLTRRRVEETAREWDKSGRKDASLLYRGVQLQRALEWQRRRI